MQVSTQNLRNKEVRSELYRIVHEECAKLNVQPKNYFNIFLDGKYTGEQVMMPEENTEAFKKVMAAINLAFGKEVGVTYRSLYV